MHIKRTFPCSENIAGLAPDGLTNTFAAAAKLAGDLLDGNTLFGKLQARVASRAEAWIETLEARVSIIKDRPAIDICFGTIGSRLRGAFRYFGGRRSHTRTNACGSRPAQRQL